MSGNAADGTGTVNETEKDDTARKQAEDEARLEEIRRIQEEIRQLSEARENLINANNELDMGCKELSEANGLLSAGGFSISGKGAYSDDISKMMEDSKSRSAEIGNQISKIDSSISELQGKINSLSQGFNFPQNSFRVGSVSVNDDVFVEVNPIYSDVHPDTTRINIDPSKFGDALSSLKSAIIHYNNSDDYLLAAGKSINNSLEYSLDFSNPLLKDNYIDISGIANTDTLLTGISYDIKRSLSSVTDYDFQNNILGTYNKLVDKYNEAYGYEGVTFNRIEDLSSLNGDITKSVDCNINDSKGFIEKFFEERGIKKDSYKITDFLEKYEDGSTQDFYHVKGYQVDHVRSNGDTSKISYDFFIPKMIDGDVSLVSYIKGSGSDTEYYGGNSPIDNIISSKGNIKPLDRNSIVVYSNSAAGLDGLDLVSSFIPKSLFDLSSITCDGFSLGAFGAMKSTFDFLSKDENKDFKGEVNLVLLDGYNEMLGGNSKDTDNAPYHKVLDNFIDNNAQFFDGNNDPKFNVYIANSNELSYQDNHGNSFSLNQDIAENISKETGWDVYYTNTTKMAHCNPDEEGETGVNEYALDNGVLSPSLLSELFSIDMNSVSKFKSNKIEIEMTPRDATPKENDLSIPLDPTPMKGDQELPLDPSVPKTIHAGLQSVFNADGFLDPDVLKNVSTTIDKSEFDALVESLSDKIKNNGEITYKDLGLTELGYARLCANDQNASSIEAINNLPSDTSEDTIKMILSGFSFMNGYESDGTNLPTFYFTRYNKDLVHGTLNNPAMLDCSSLTSYLANQTGKVDVLVYTSGFAGGDGVEEAASNFDRVAGFSGGVDETLKSFDIVEGELKAGDILLNGSGNHVVMYYGQDNNGNDIVIECTGKSHNINDNGIRNLERIVTIYDKINGYHGGFTYGDEMYASGDILIHAVDLSQYKKAYRIKE